MSILTNGAASRAPKRRRLSASPGDHQEHRDRMNDVAEGGGASDLLSSSVDTKRVQSSRVPRKAGDAQNVRRRGSDHREGQVLPIGGLNKASMMTLQITELLSETRPNFEKLESLLAPTLVRLRSIISELPSRPPVLIGQAEKSLWKESKVVIPFANPRPSSDTKYKFEFQKPADISHPETLKFRTGLTGVHTMIWTMTMPPHLFQEKDYLNFRAFHKRAFYLACIAAGIKTNARDEFELQFEDKDDIDSLPTLVIRATAKSPQGFMRSKCHIQIVMAFPESAIPIEKTHPSKASVRSSGNAGVMENPTATPFYNSCIRSVASIALAENLLQNASRSCETFSDASRLAAIWLKQRGMGSPISQGGFGPYEWDVICALLLETGGHKGQPLLSRRYTALQLFKALLQFLAVKDLTKSSMMLRAVGLPPPASDCPVLYDGTLGINILFKMSPWSYQALRHDALISLTAINAKNEDNFDAVFIVRVAEGLIRFDELYQLDLPAVNGDPQSTDPLAGLKQIHRVLSRGLDDRVKQLNITTTPLHSWDVENKRPKNRTQHSRAQVGLLLAPEATGRLVDHGPSAEDQEGAADFRSFWGEKAELRRFKDGSISESLVWSDRSPVTLQIIRHLLQKHFQSTPESVLPVGNGLEKVMLPDHGNIKAADAFKLMNNAYQSLTSQLHGLNDLPLRIRSIQPADAQLSSSSLSCPFVSTVSAPADVFIEFENSTRWPDSLPAVQHTKIAFLLKLAEVFQSAHPETSTRVGLENTSTASLGHLNTSYLDIIVPAPAAGLPSISFRLRIHHERDLALLEKSLATRTLLHRPKQTSLTSALLTQKRTSMALPRHTSTVRTLATRFPALSASIRLLKKWTASHLLPPTLLPDPLLDLLAIHAFTSPQPWSTPSTPATAFLRILHTLARWDWAVAPLLVDTSLDASLTASADSVEALRTRFAAWRKLDPGMNNVVLFVGSSLDPTGVVWTQGARPPRVVAARLTALARASVQIVRERGEEEKEEKEEKKEEEVMKEGEEEEGEEAWLRSLFRSPLTDFDFLIHLKRGFCFGGEGRHGGERSKFKNLAVQEDLDLDVGGGGGGGGGYYDPVACFLRDLEEVFGQNALFFYDADGGKVIAGLWNPRVLGNRDWRVRLGVSSVPMAAGGDGPAAAEEGAGKDRVVVNQAGILAEIAMMGEGLVQKVEIVTDFVK